MLAVIVSVSVEVVIPLVVKSVGVDLVGPLVVCSVNVEPVISHVTPVDMELVTKSVVESVDAELSLATVPVASADVELVGSLVVITSVDVELVCSSVVGSVVVEPGRLVV